MPVESARRQPLAEGLEYEMQDPRRKNTRVISTRPNWLIRTIALAVAFHAVFLVSPWFEHFSHNGFGRGFWYDGYLGTFPGRVVLCVAQFALAILIWKRSTKRDVGSGGRWYNRWPWN